MPDSRQTSRRVRPWIIGTVIAILLTIVLFPAGCLGFTLYCWVGKGKDPGAVLAEWKRERRRRFVEARGADIMARIRHACPEELEGWQMVPYRNDLAGQYYELLSTIRRQYHYRRADGSDDLSLDVVVNPPLEGLPWYEANPLIPDAARAVASNAGVQAWIHEAYLWNYFLPRYDQKPGAPKVCMAQV